MLKKDKLITGIIIGILVPAALYALFLLVMEIFGIYVQGALSEKMQLILVAVNAIMMRQFMVKRDQDLIGRGILMVTFVFVFAHMLYYYTDWLQ